MTFDAAPTAPLIIGHRGAPGYLPEHTRSSYLLALAQGVDAVEPDIVPTADGVLVIRHENEISGTTDVADRAEFADRRTTKTIDGQSLTGWFTEDFTWAELSTLRCRERLPQLRPASAAHDGEEPIMRLRDLLALLDEDDRDAGAVIEIKHAAFFASLGFDMAGLLAQELRDAGWTDRDDRTLVIESFEQRVLDDLVEHGIHAIRIYLMEAAGTAADLAGEPDAPTYEQQRTPEALARLADELDGISVDRAVLLRPDAEGNPHPDAALVEQAHALGMLVFTWTCRPENAMLLPAFRIGDDPAAHGDFRSEWALLRDIGVDGVFVDHPDLGAAAFGS